MKMYRYSVVSNEEEIGTNKASIVTIGLNLKVSLTNLPSLSLKQKSETLAIFHWECICY